MKIRPVRGRKASVEMWMRFYEMILIAIIAVVFFSFVKDIRENTILEKNYIARDVALTLDTVYAAPGEISAVYPSDELKESVNMKKYIVEIKENLVRVREPEEQVAKIYWFADNGQTEIDFASGKKPQIVITKQGNAMDIRAR